MKIKPQNINSFFKKQKTKIKVCLIYGPNKGLVNQLIKNIIDIYIGPQRDPFEFSEIDNKQIDSENYSLIDDLLSYGFLPGYRVVQINNLSDKYHKDINNIIEKNVEDLFIILKHDELGPKSKLRYLIENHDTCTSIPCYEDTEQDLQLIIKSFFKNKNINLSSDNLHFLTSILSPDRDLSLRQLEIISLYYHNTSEEMTIDTLNTLVIDSSTTTLNDLIYSVVSGNSHKVPKLLTKYFHDSSSAIGPIRATSLHFDKLCFVLSKINDGFSENSSLNMLKPRIFFKYENEFKKQLRIWNLDKIYYVQNILFKTEVSCKSFSSLQFIMLERAFLNIAQISRSLQS
ncbi:DNA polymerase III subunit delta [Alphaproteobacteria bacterium]|nr:DNA polymerase III subunit delta [Alphaproteobacteria bacterium]